jgi:alpha-tubulin suppressor-like RCC1 family protein
MNANVVILLISVVVFATIAATYMIIKQREIEKFSNNKYFTHISAGSRHTVIINNLENIYSCGYNHNGRLGTGDTTHVIAPIKIQAVKNYEVLNIFAGNTHTFYLIRINEKVCVYASGDNTNYVMGLGPGAGTYFHTPVEITFFSSNNIEINKISPGWNHTLFLSTDGKVYACGNNNVGQLGIAAKLRENLNEFDKTTDTVKANINDTSPRKTPTLIDFFTEPIIDIAGKSYAHSLFLTSSGKVYSCGWNWYGQLGLGNNKNYFTPQEVKYFTNTDNMNTANIINIAKIETSMTSSVFISNKHEVYVCGNNIINNFGSTMGIEEASSPKEVAFFGEMSPPVNIAEVHCGAEHVMFLTTDKKIFGCGKNNQGQLGNGNTTGVSEPIEIRYFSENNLVVDAISVGAFHTLFLTSEGIVFACGNNSAGQLGIGNMETTYSSTPVKCDIPIAKSKADMTYRRSFGIIDNDSTVTVPEAE